MDETSAADVDGSREEGHTQRFVVRYALERANDVGTFEVLRLHC